MGVMWWRVMWWYGESDTVECDTVESAIWWRAMQWRVMHTRIQLLENYFYYVIINIKSIFPLKTSLSYFQMGMRKTEMSTHSMEYIFYPFISTAFLLHI